MAELASGAVSSLLGVIRNEAALLGGVRGDVQFIKEEMESMNSFLLYLARTVPADGGGDHDEQVRTWMNQVRLLAGDCNNCIDLYLYRGNPDIHLPKGRLLRYLRWTPWFLQRTVAQRRAALKLRELKDRARDVGERRLRYGVEVPAKLLAAAAAARGLPMAAAAAAPLSLPSGAEAAAYYDQDIDDQDMNRSGPRGTLFLLGLRFLDLERYFNGKLAEWIKQAAEAEAGDTAAASSSEESSMMAVPAIAIAAPDDEAGAKTLALEALAAAKTHFRQSACVLVDIPEVHYSYMSLSPADVLCYIWRCLEQEQLEQQSPPQQGTSKGEQGGQHVHWSSRSQWGIYREKREAIRQIKHNIRDVMKVHDKIEDIKRKISEVSDNQLQLQLDLKETMKKKEGEVEGQISEKPLAVLLLLLNSVAVGAVPKLAIWYDKVIEITSRKLVDHMEVTGVEATEKEKMIRLDQPEKKYESILREVFPKNSNTQEPLQTELQTTDSTATAGTSARGEDQIKVMIQKAKQEILHEVQEKLDALQRLHEGKTDKEQGTSFTEGSMVAIEKIQSKLPEDIAEITNKIEQVRQKIEEMMRIKGIVDKIKARLEGGRTLFIILKIHPTGWDEETRNAFSFLLGRVAGAVIVTTSNNTQRAKKYCNPPCEPMEYSLVGLYHDIALQLKRKRMNEEDNDPDPDPQILRGILEGCEPYEFCMKIFVHALHAKPKRSNEELRKLHTSLKAISPKSFDSIANKMFKFSYNDLQKEYKSCLLYLAIFPPRHKMKRSTLIGRWVVEGLITTEDWRWSSSMRKAKICFDELIDRWLVYPGDIGATGEVKSCMIGERVREFITKTAKKQHIVETRLSHHLAHHFSISNDLRLRSSDKIEDFLKKLSESSQFYLLKVLDLEGCHCFARKNKNYLKDICCKIKLLKYLSLRRTDVVQLPNEINNLHELEVLDVRQTSVSSTRNLCLLKLKRLLAGQVDPNPNSNTVISSDIPEKVEKMDGMEVLSGVNPKKTQDLKDIGKLWQLRKLGVVIEDRESYLNSLIEGICDLHECIQSLSITLVPKRGHKYTHSRRCLLPQNNIRPKFLKSLNINGRTDKVNLLANLLLGNENSQLTKITLSNTSLSKHNLVLLSNLPMLCCVKLQCTSYAESKITFKKNEFKNLKYFLIEGCNITEIIFDHGATELKKMVLTLSDGLNLSGLDKLQRLEELELNDNSNKSTTSNGNNDNSSSNYDDNAINKNSITTATTAATPTDDTTTIATRTAVAPNTNSTDTTNQTANTTVADTAAMAAANASTTTAATTDTNGSPIAAATTAPIRAPTDSNIIKNSMLHSLFDNAKGITKVTLRGTMLKQDGLKILAMNPNIRYLVLLDNSYDGSQLTFDKEDFPKLNVLTVQCSSITKISFTPGSCPMLENFIWTFNFTNIELLTGIGNLLRLKEVQFNGEFFCDKVKEEINKYKNKLYFTHYKPAKNTTY